MNDSDFTIEKRNPTLHEYLELRKEAGMKERDPASVAKGLNNSIFSVCLMFEGNIQGMGRVIGDGGTALQITDMAVRPSHQGKGLGGRILKALVEYIQGTFHPSVFVSLIADEGAAKFYQKYGFEVRPPDRPGMFLKRD